MQNSPAIKPPESLAEALTPIASLTEQQFAELVNAISGARSFSLSKDQINDLKNKLPETGVTLPYTLGTLAFLYSQISQLFESPDLDAGAMSKLVADLDAENAWGERRSLMQDRLTKLLERRASHQRYRKLERLKSGFVPNAVGFTSFVDLRPNFNEGVPEKILDFVFLVQLRISTDSSRPDLRQIVVQMDADGLEELKKSIDRIYEKLDALNKDEVAQRIATS